jgi:hypothetical protein
LQVPQIVWVLWTVAALGSGCDGAGDGVAALEERLRDQSSTKSKSGTLRALEVASTAHLVARGAAAPTQKRCELELPDDRAYTYSFSLEFERSSAAGVESRWTERRTLRRDDDGDLAVTMEADFRTEFAAEGRRSPQWRTVGEHSYVSVDGRAFYRRDATAIDRRRLVHSASATLQTLLDAVSTGWSRTGLDSDAVSAFKIGGERLVCGPSSPEEDLSFDSGWLRRFKTRATPLSGELSILDEHSRRLDARWQLEDGSTLEAHFEGRLVDGAEAVEAPDPSSIVVVERDRSLRHIEGLLEDMGRRGLIEGSLIKDDRRSTTPTKSDHETK